MPARVRSASSGLKMARDTESTLPTQAELREPVLAALRALGGAASNDEIETHVAAALGLTDGQRSIRHGAGGTRTELAYRLAWARTRLKEAGAIVGDGHKRWRIT